MSLAEPGSAADGVPIVTLDEGPVTGPALFRSAQLRLCGGGGGDLDLVWSLRMDGDDEWTLLDLPAMRVEAAGGGAKVRTIQGESGFQRFDGELLATADGLAGLLFQPTPAGLVIQPGISVAHDGAASNINLGAIGPLSTDFGDFDLMPQIESAPLVVEGLPPGALARHECAYTVRDDDGVLRSLELRVDVRRVDSPRADQAADATVASDGSSTLGSPALDS